MSLISTDFPYGIMIHWVHDPKAKPLGAGSISSADLFAKLESIGLENFLAPQDWIELSLKKKLKPSHRCLTFDDGLLCQFENCFDWLSKKKFKAFWFLNTAPFSGKPIQIILHNYFIHNSYATREDFYSDYFLSFSKLNIPFEEKKFSPFYLEKIRNFPFYSEHDLKYRYIRDQTLNTFQHTQLMQTLLKKKSFDENKWVEKIWILQSQAKALSEKGHEIGLHSHSHPALLSAMSEDIQDSELRTNRDTLQKELGIEPKSIAYPCGEYNEYTLSILKRLGILVGFRSSLGIHQTLPDPYQPLEQRREDVVNLKRSP